MKLKKLFKEKGEVEVNSEISESNESESSHLDNTWQSWSFKASPSPKMSDDKRGRLKRASSERIKPKRSKSEVGKRLADIEADLGLKKNKKKSSSKSMGGSFRAERSSDARSKIDKLALQRSGSDPDLTKSGLESMFPAKPAKPVKKLRGGKRSSFNMEENKDEKKEKVDLDGTSRSRRRSRSASSRGRRISESAKEGETSKQRSSSKKRSTSKLRRGSKKDPGDGVDADEKVSVNTDGTKDSKDKKKKKKSDRPKRSKSKDSFDDNSLPSNVECDGASLGSGIDDSFHKKKKKDKKEKRKSDKTKRSSRSTFPDLPPDEFGDGLEGLAEEFKRSKDKINGDSEKEGASLFDKAWNETEQTKPGIDNEEAERLRQAVEQKQNLNNEQQEEILKLQQQLSTALQKQLTMSEEHIREKNEFMNVSRELERVRVELAEARQERREVLEEMKERDRLIEEDMNKIDSLERAIDKQLEKEESLTKKIQSSEEEIEHLLNEMQKLETKKDDGEGGGGGASFVELRNAKKALADSLEESSTQKERIEHLEKELKDAMTVPQLQIEELDQENKALQGRLKGERLEYTSKLASKDDVIQSLRAELSTFTSSPDAQDLQSALQKLSDAQKDATTVREDLAAHVKTIEQLRGEKEDFMAELNSLKDNNAFMEKTVKELTEKNEALAKKVTVWTEKTYDWKKRAEDAERQLSEAKDGEEGGNDLGEADPQGMFLQAAMDKGKEAGGRLGGAWGLFKKAASPENEDQSADEIRIRVLEEQNLDFEAKIAQLNSDIVKMQTAHKEELYNTKKKIAQLEGENEALALQNSTLEQLTKDQ